MVFFQAFKTGSLAGGFDKILQRPDNSSRIIAFFRKPVLPRMVKVSHYDAENFVVAFLAVSLNECCGFFEAFDATAIFMEYVNLVNFMFRRHIETGRTEQNIYYFGRKINSKALATNKNRPMPRFKHWHAEMTCIQSRLWLSQRAYCMTFLHVVFFESAETEFTRSYFLSSKRMKYVMIKVAEKSYRVVLDNVFETKLYSIVEKMFRKSNRKKEMVTTLWKQVFNVLL